LTDPSLDEIATLLATTAFDVVHFVAHGFVEYAFPELSRIMLGDGFPLTVFEISSILKFKGALVTLSACESGMKGYHRSDFGNSLLTACFQAGAPIL
jgi:CHAT domain-containing protein